MFQTNPACNIPQICGSPQGTNTFDGVAVVVFVFAGMNVAIVLDGETAYTAGYGVTDLDSNQPVTNDTYFCVASVTKAFAATLLGQQLQERG